MKKTNTLLIVIILELGFIGWNQVRFAPITEADIGRGDREVSKKIPLSIVYGGNVEVSGSVEIDN